MTQESQNDTDELFDTLRQGLQAVQASDTLFSDMASLRVRRGEIVDVDAYEDHDGVQKLRFRVNRPGGLPSLLLKSADSADLRVSGIDFAACWVTFAPREGDEQ